jgi:hypothetical protein
MPQPAQVTDNRQCAHGDRWFQWNRTRKLLKKQIEEGFCENAEADGKE